MLRPSFLLLLALGLPSCVTRADAGWADDLEQAITDRSPWFAPLPQGFPNGFAAPADDVRPGDELLYGIALDVGRTRRVWYLLLRVADVQVQPRVAMRTTQAFEDRVRPVDAVDRRTQQRTDELVTQLREGGMAALATDTPIANIRVELFDDDGDSLGVAHSHVDAQQLREGLATACRAGYAQRDVMRGRVALGRDADMLELDERQYDDVVTVARGIEAGRGFFRILRSNPVTDSILRQVIALPSIWSMLTNLGVRATFEADFFASRPLPNDCFANTDRELWSAPISLQLNDQPALLVRVVVGASRAPDATAAGVFAIVGRHPTDESRRLHVQLLASRRANNRN